MALYSDDVINELISRNEITSVVSSYVQIKQKGGDYFGLCPFHRENSPSFSVSPHKQMFYCFGCGAGGGVISFVMRIENLGFTDAVKKLAERAHYTLPETGGTESSGMHELRESIYSMNTQAAKFFYDRLISEQGEKAREYLHRRRISNGIIKKFGLGYAPDSWDGLYKFLKSRGFDDSALEKSGLTIKTKNGLGDKFRGRLMFPIIDAQDRVVGFGGRILDKGEPKYLNSPDTPVFVKSRNLFALNYARKTKAAEVIIVEGYMDALALYQAGFDNAAASLGTAFNRDHCRVLTQYFRGKTAVLLFDSDTAGENAALRAIPVLKQQGVTAKVLKLEGAKDPDDFINSYGAEAFSGALSGAKNPIVFRLDLLRSKYNIADDDEKISYLNSAAAVIADIDNAIEQDVYINALMRETGVSAAALKGQVERLAASQTPLPGFAPPIYVNKPSLQSSIPEGVMSAARNILYCLSSHDVFYKPLSKAISADELMHPLYIRLYGEIRKTRDKGGVVSAGELVNRLEDIDEQQAAAAIFARAFPYENDTELKKALNQQIKIIKLACLTAQIQDAVSNDGFDLAKELGEARINLPNLYI